MSDIRIRCPECGRRFKVKALARKFSKLPCPNCSAYIPLPKDADEKRGFLRTIQATIMPKPGQVRPDLADIVQAALPGAVVFKKRKRKKPQPHHKARARNPLAGPGTYGIDSAKSSGSAEEARRLAAAKAAREQMLALSRMTEGAPAEHGDQPTQPEVAALKTGSNGAEDLRHFLADADTSPAGSDSEELRAFAESLEESTVSKIARIRSKKVSALSLPAKPKPPALPADKIPTGPPKFNLSIPSPPASLEDASEPMSLEVMTADVVDSVEEAAHGPPPPPQEPIIGVEPPAASKTAHTNDETDSDELSWDTSEVWDDFEEEALQLNSLGYVVVVGFLLFAGAIAAFVGYFLSQVL